MTRKFEVVRDPMGLGVGTIVYENHLCDYGIKSGDERVLGKECINVSLVPNEYPLTCVPLDTLKEIKE